MNIVLHSGGMPFNGETLLTKSLGGAESCAYYMARELASRGHRVVVFTDSPDEGIFDGVTYCNAGERSQEHPLGMRFSSYACDTPHDVLIIQRHPLGFHKDYASKINILQMHDIAVQRNAMHFAAGAFRIDMATVVSEYHKHQVNSVYNLRDGFLRVVPNGVEPDLYRPAGFGETFGQLEAVRAHKGMRYLYQSRPERGLEHLVHPKGIMAQLREKGSNAHLFVCTYDHNPDDVKQLYQMLFEAAEELPNVTLLGSLSKRQLAMVQMECDALLYPTEFPEVSCITAMEAMHAGLPFLSSECAALPETCKDSGSILLPLKDGKADEEAFILLLQEFEHDENMRQLHREAQLEAAGSRTWEDAVDALEDEIERIFKERAANPDRVLRHLIETSDIKAAEYFLSKRMHAQDVQPLSQLGLQSVAELAQMYEFTQSPEAMAAHYALEEQRYHRDLKVPKGADPVEYISDEPELFDLHTRNTRYVGTLQEFAKAVAGKTSVRVAEFGCSHGLITLSLAKLYPQIQFTGFDFMPFATKVATRSAEKLGLTNVTFEKGTLETLVEAGPFDVVLAPEVLEHQPDYMMTLRSLLNAVSDGGYLLVTTPSGRWEWHGLETYNKARQHLHHFEREDIAEIFEEFPHTILCAPAKMRDRAHAAMGWWVYSVRKVPNARLRPIDYERKLRQLAPRETISLCMIVKDAEEHITTALRSAAPWVDEIIIAVDETTKDKTDARIAEVREQFPFVRWLVFTGRSPMEVGFDEARNATLRQASGDWIMWMDADETLINGHNAWRLLRKSAYEGFAIDQHHMSQEPPTHISTDHPTRMFRADLGAQFYGVVHEHPEVEIGKAIPHTYPIKDLSFMHYGYTSEKVRRARYVRNYPLLLRDLEKYPNRPLNKFLYVRDLAQGIAFEGEATGRVSAAMLTNARKAVDLFDDLVNTSPMLRLVLDAIPFYSTASATLGGTFEATVKVVTSKPEIPGVKATVDIEGVFHSRETYKKLLERIAQETTVNYDAEYV